ncbi:endonuclease domain-containing protein [Gordonia sp. (in: high G+C Gram-positive bacteria)]|uniref:endonuclease domain-containing protein n=1 Tax=Gordonia sp. (in: high G+C Gram-positive bacteria) TaxID=84139 RepID=UPI0039E4B8C5
MRNYDEEARTAHFQEAARRAVGDLRSGIRYIDGTTAVGRAQLLSVRERILATAANAHGRPVVTGVSASILHGTNWFDPFFDVELIHDLSGSTWKGAGRTVRRYQLAPSDVTDIDGVLVTTRVRTAFDVGRIPPAWRGLGNLDALHRAAPFSILALIRYIDDHRGWRYIRQLRAIAPLVDGAAESPPESWLRLLLIQSGLPLPELQIVVVDETGHGFARVDMGYRGPKIAIEYDGEEFHSLAEHQDRDARRDAKLEALGWVAVRVDAERLFDRPWTILTEIEHLLHERGAY